VVLPVLAGRSKYTKELLVANLISFAIGIPLFAILPAVGPWHYYHFLPTLSQTEVCEVALLTLRLPGVYVSGSTGAGVVCFPSFHVVWAIFFTSTLWGFRWLRIPLVLLSGMIILSTMTTGWHYFADVLGGIILAILSIVLAKVLMRRMDSSSTDRRVWQPEADGAPPQPAPSPRSRDEQSLAVEERPGCSRS
jgi:membrane-associated phospholipid phosphatase